MFIRSMTPALNVIRIMRNRNVEIGRLMEQLSTGRRINRAADDPAGFAISEKMKAQIRGLRQASRNAQDGISLIQTAEGALHETHAMIQRIRELVVQAANGTNQESDLEKIQLEIDQLLEQIQVTGKTTEFNQKTLLDGTYKGGTGGIVLQIGANAGQTMTIYIEDMKTGALGLDGLDVRGKTREEISSLLKTVDEAVGRVSSQRAALGAYQNRLEHTINNLDTAAENLQAAESRIADADMAQAMMKLIQNNLLQEVSMAMLAQFYQHQRRMVDLLLKSFEPKSTYR